MATLAITEGPSEGKHFSLGRHRLVMVGRDEGATFQVLDEHVSRRHLQIKFDERENRHIAIDVGSVNGVIVNGAKLDERAERELANGDQIKIGSSVIVYTTEDYPDAEQALQGARQLGERRRSTLAPKH